MLPRVSGAAGSDPDQQRAYLGTMVGHLTAPAGGPPFALKPHLDLGDRLRTSSLGLRSPELSAVKSTPRVMVLGDSFAYGFGLTEEQTFCARLADRLRGKVEIANAAVSGQQIQDFRAQFERLADAVKPDVVVVTFVINDLDDSQLLDPSGYTRWPQIEELPDGYFTATGNLQRMAELSGLHGDAFAEFLGKHAGGDHFLAFGLGPHARSRWDRYASELARIRDGAEKRGAKTVLFSFAPPQSGIHAPLLGVASKLGIPLVTLSETMNLAEKRYRLTWDPHPSAAANAVFADRLLGGLVGVGALEAPDVKPVKPLWVTPELERKWTLDAGGYALSWIHPRVAFAPPEARANLHQAVAGFERIDGLLGARAVVLLRSPGAVKHVRLEASVESDPSGETATKRTIEVRLGRAQAPSIVEVSGAGTTIELPLPEGAAEPSVPVAGDSLVEVDLRDPVVAAASPDQRKSQLAVRIRSLSLE